ncbi:SEL1-like repeat protein [Brevundimonas bacteroides]|uniref:SEL1-like repeat protein n=1 Tax=Brevundimonas bacteroides TaxID=74311 RepID=UPI00049533EA|nr:SEL1-like repeat protein [Brevundimonas bacteroides]
MSAAAAPWSVKGIDPKAREVAKDLARRSGMTLGEWLNTMIMEDGEEDDGVQPLPRRAHASESIERRSRSRRVDDAYDLPQRSYREPADDTLHRVAASVEAIAARLEAAERRSTIAIQGVDQAVSGLVRRLEAQDQQAGVHARRIDDISEELKEGHRRLRAFEREVGPKSAETLSKVEQALGTLAGRLYDMEERQRTGFAETRQRLDGFEKTDTAVAALTSRLYDIEERQRAGAQTLAARIDAVEKAAGAGAGTELLSEVGRRLDAAQNQTTQALKSLEHAFAGLDQRLRAAETRAEPEGSKEAARFEKLAETLSRQVETNRAEMMRKLETAEHEGRMSRIEAAVQSLGEQARAAEQRSAQGIEAMGREVLRIAQNLDSRVDRIETAGDARLEKFEAALTKSVSEKIERDMGRYGQAIEHRLTRAEDQNAIALEKLGTEITRISDRLADRIAQSERKSAQALEDIGRRLGESSERIEQRYDRASGELAERMRLSEERTAALLAEARETLEQRLAQPVPPRAEPVPEPATRAADFAQPDWRAAAFPADPDFGGAAAPADGWSIDPLSADVEPFPAAPGVSPAQADETSPASDSFDALPRRIEPAAEAAPFGAAPAISPFAGFGGADVSDALDAIAEVEAAPAPYIAEMAAPSARVIDEGDDFAAETEFVDPRRMRASMAAGAAAGRSNTTRDTIQAARAAMNGPQAAPPAAAPRVSFGLGLKKGGKSKLQERLDKQAGRDGTVKKAFLASVTGMAVVGGLYATGRLTGYDMADIGQALTGATASATETTPLAALALTPTGDAPIDAAPADLTEAQTLYAQAIEQLDRDDPAGVETLTRAANLGEPQAQLKLAGLYQTGEAGLEVDEAESRTWARRAAESGDARGQHAYGMYLYDGVGGAQNRAEALDWLKRAADQGLVDSQYNVARIYENGDQGIAPNLTQAYRWYLIAARAGDPQAQAAVDRLSPTIPAAARQTARAQAEAFALEPLA